MMKSRKETAKGKKIKVSLTFTRSDNECSLFLIHRMMPTKIRHEGIQIGAFEIIIVMKYSGEMALEN